MPFAHLQCARLLHCRVRRLIINADDLGFTRGVNRAIREAHAFGLVTSATVMANSRAFDDAIAVAKSQTSLGVGCHVVLVDGTPVLPPAEVTSLLASSSSSFRDSFSQFALGALSRRFDENQLATEAAAQITRIQSAGLRLSHFDTHKHVHLFPSVLKALLRAAKASGLRALRNPFAPIKPLAAAHLLRRPRLWKRYSEVTLLRKFSSRFREMVRAEGMVTTDGTFGILSTGALDSKLFNAIIGSIPEGTWELCCHPGYNDADLSALRTRLRQSREKELQVLTSEETRATLERNGIELITYWDLQ